jgi:transposase
VPQIRFWEVSDEFWTKVEPLIPARRRAEDRTYQRAAGGGRKPMPARQIFAAIVYVLRTGRHWKALPGEYGSASAIHAHFQNWHRAGFFVALWRAGLAEYDGLKGIAWQWQSIGGALLKASPAPECVGRNPTDREKKGRKRSLLVDGRGVPLSLVASGANVHDVMLLAATLDAIVIPRPGPGEQTVQNLCADAGCRGKAATEQVARVVVVRTSNNAARRPEPNAPSPDSRRGAGWSNAHTPG